MGVLFISHVALNEPEVVEIAGGLEAEGYSTWYYERDGVVGSSYLTTTGQVIDESDAVIIVISNAAIKSSTQVTKEIVRAVESKRPMIPLLLGLNHEEFRQKQPEWREALGATVTLPVNENNIQGTIEPIIQGLKRLGILPENIREEPIQKYIANKIKNAFVMIADISKDPNKEIEEYNLNTCIEAGIARGAEVSNFYLVSRAPRKSPPFIFRDKEVFFYEDEKELFKLAENLLLPYRRRIINSEL